MGLYWNGLKWTGWEEGVGQEGYIHDALSNSVLEVEKLDTFGMIQYTGHIYPEFPTKQSMLGIDKLQTALRTLS